MRKLFRYPGLMWGALLTLGCLIVTLGYSLQISFFKETSIGWLLTGWIAAGLTIIFTGIDAYRSERVLKRRKENEKN